MINNAQWITESSITHRGLCNKDVPENSLRAFELCIEKGYAIELDVQMLCDGTLVVFHDWTLDRMTAGEGVLSYRSITEIEQLRLINSDQIIPQLSDVLNLVKGQVPLLIELKNKTHKRSFFVKNFLKEMSNYRGRYAVSSFDSFLLKEFDDHTSTVIKGLNFTNYKNSGVIFGWVKKISMYMLWFVSRLSADFYVCHASMLPYCWIATKARKKQKPLLTWGVKSKKEFESIQNTIDNNICDMQY